MSVALGVDWAGGQWLCFAQREQERVLIPGTYGSITDLWTEYNNGTDITRLCIDIPIGLPTGPEERAVDRQCRSYLDRYSSDFRVPVRAALETDSPEQANAQSRAVTHSPPNSDCHATF